MSIKGDIVRCPDGDYAIIVKHKKTETVIAKGPTANGPWKAIGLVPPKSSLWTRAKNLSKRFLTPRTK